MIAATPHAASPTATGWRRSPWCRHSSNALTRTGGGPGVITRHTAGPHVQCGTLRDGCPRVAACEKHPGTVNSAPPASWTVAVGSRTESAVRSLLAHRPLRTGAGKRAGGGLGPPSTGSSSGGTNTGTTRGRATAPGRSSSALARVAVHGSVMRRTEGMW